MSLLNSLKANIRSKYKYKQLHVVTTGTQGWKTSNYSSVRLQELQIMKHKTQETHNWAIKNA